MSILKQYGLAFVVVLIAAWVVYKYSNTNVSVQVHVAQRGSPGFDFFLLALHWPDAFFSVPRPPTQEFTVHGLWPQYNGKAPPEFCSPVPPMTDTPLVQFKTDLLRYWPDLASAQDFRRSKKFWRRQWKKHGSCSSNKFAPHHYLNITIDLAKKYAPLILSQLEAAGINPDGTTIHSDADMLNAIKDATGHDAILSFGFDAFGQRQLEEVRLCVKNDGITLFDCNPVAIFPTRPPSPPPPSLLLWLKLWFN